MNIFLALIAVLILAFVGLGIVSQKGGAKGLSGNQLGDMGSRPNWVSSEAGIQPERHTTPLVAASIEQAVQAIRATGGTITAQGPDYVSATYMSRIFKFVDDVELRWDAEAGLCHIRSASRVGYSDRGVNRKRVETIRAAL